MKRSHTVGPGVNSKQSGRSSSSRASRMQRWSLALRRHWFSSTSEKCQKSTDCDFKIINPVEIIFAQNTPEKTIFGYSPNDSSSASCSTDRPLVEPSYPANVTSSAQSIVKRKSLRRFFSNGQQQQGSSSSSHSRPQSVSLAVRKGNDQQQIRHSATDPIHSGFSSLVDQQQQDGLLSRVCLVNLYVC
uniref:Uncharacterized protein n=1 Tax=Onchocerca volvulus TaxID=6282 RepID=A0A2K6VRA7_ONCVO